MAQPQLDLIGDERFVDAFFQPFDLHETEIADAEMAHLAAALQLVECAGHQRAAVEARRRRRGWDER